MLSADRIQLLRIFAELVETTNPDTALEVVSQVEEGRLQIVVNSEDDYRTNVVSDEMLRLSAIDERYNFPHSLGPIIDHGQDILGNGTPLNEETFTPRFSRTLVFE